MSDPTDFDRMRAGVGFDQVDAGLHHMKSDITGAEFMAAGKVNHIDFRWSCFNDVQAAIAENRTCNVVALREKLNEYCTNYVRGADTPDKGEQMAIDAAGALHIKTLMDRDTPEQIGLAFARLAVTFLSVAVDQRETVTAAAVEIVSAAIARAETPLQQGDALGELLRAVSELTERNSGNVD